MQDEAGSTPRVFVQAASLCERSSLGVATRIWALEHLLSGAVIGNTFTDCLGLHVESGAVIGDRVTVENHVLIFDKVTIKDDVFIGPGVVFTNDLRPGAHIKRSGGALGATTERRGATLGAGIDAPYGTSMGAGKVVPRDLQPTPSWSVIRHGGSAGRGVVNGCLTISAAARNAAGCFRIDGNTASPEGLTEVGPANEGPPTTGRERHRVHDAHRREDRAVAPARNPLRVPKNDTHDITGIPLTRPRAASNQFNRNSRYFDQIAGPFDTKPLPGSDQTSSIRPLALRGSEISRYFPHHMLEGTNK